MNVGDERSRSCWLVEAPAIEAPSLDRDFDCDVAIVGAGIAGLSVAYELGREGRSVAVIDRGEIARGMTARTTAHLTTEVDDRYSDLIRVRGEPEAKLYHQSQVAAVDRIEAIAREEAIGCDFMRVDGFLYAAEASHGKMLEEEYDACRRLGVPVEWADGAPVPGIDTGRALRFPRQARFHPLKYLAGLAAAIERRDGRLFAHTAYVNDEEKDGGVSIETAGGPKIRAGAAVFATNSPVNNQVTVHPKQTPYRTYVIAGSAPADAVPDALVWDTWQKRGSDEFYHYVRLQPLGSGEVLLIAGGEDHRSGEADDMAARFERLEQWTRARWPGLGQVEFRWSGQVLETVDFMCFSGRNPGSENIYIHTGDSGLGIVNGVAGALTIAPLILGRESRFAKLLDPDRKSVASIPSLREYVSGQAGVLANYSEYVRGGDVASADEIKPGEGAVIREGLSKIAAFRRDDGTLVRRSAKCTHMGCIVQWNPFELCWDCPCHGSQFAAEGEVLNGPATRPLAWTDDNKAKREAADASAS